MDQLHGTTVLFIHGFGANPDLDFYPTLTPLLEHEGIQYMIPALPDSSHPEKNAWLARIKHTYDHIDGPVILVGHSLGTRAALLFLEQFEVKVAATLLIAPFSNSIANADRRHGVYASFFDHKIDIGVVKLRCPKFVVMHSKDDDAIDFAQGQEIAQDLGAELITYEDRHHFSEPQNAPEIFRVLHTLVL